MIAHLWVEQASRPALVHVATMARDVFWLQDPFLIYSEKEELANAILMPELVWVDLNFRVIFFEISIFKNSCYVLNGCGESIIFCT